MKKSLKITIAVAFLIFGAVIFSVNARADFAAIPDADQKNLSVKTLYLNNCARCHGADGKADTELGKLYEAPDLTGKKVKKMSGKKMTRIIQNGDGSMPAFKKKLSAKEVSALVNYIKIL